MNDNARRRVRARGYSSSVGTVVELEDITLDLAREAVHAIVPEGGSHGFTAAVLPDASNM
jgi:hypothetical protein